MSSEIVKFNEIAATAPQILETSKLRVSKAKEAGEGLLSKMVQMNDQIDEEANSYLVKARKTLDLINKQRKPITQFLDAVKMEFTTIEADLDPKKVDSIVARIIKRRNDYATAKLEEQKKREEEARRKQAIEKEKADVQANIEIALENYFSEYVTDFIQGVYDRFNAMTLETFTQVEQWIRTLSGAYDRNHFEQFQVGVSTIYLTKDDKVAIKVRVMNEKFPELTNRFAEKIKEIKIDLISKLPSKKVELEQISKANAAEAARLKAEKEKRENEEKERLAQQQKEAADKAKAEAGAKAKAAGMQSMFDAELIQKANRTGYDITVKHPAGYGLVFQFWFEKEGKDLTIDQMEKKTLGQMKAFCEKYAHKNDEIIQSPYLEYKEIAKVAARK